VEATPAPNVYDDDSWELVATYRVTLWEQPARPVDIEERPSGWSPYPGAPMGWEQATYELGGANDVRRAIEWAEAALAAGKGPASRRGVPVDDRECVIYAKAETANRWLHIVGWIPVLPADPRLNLKRLR
jgi:hypothetical protein